MRGRCLRRDVTREVCCPAGETMLVEVELKDKPPKVVWYRHETLLKPGEPRVAMNYNVETGACSTTAAVA